MTEHPIIFNSEMVRTILDGRKTQTRMIIKPQPIWKEKPLNSLHAAGWFWEISSATYSSYRKESLVVDIVKHCPYGKVGDTLWVRETWMLYNHMGTFIGKIPKQSPKDLFVGYKADRLDKDKLFTWRSPFHIPRWAARIFLEITNIRVERVQDIGESDAEAEGTNCDRTYREDFKHLWNSINDKRGYGWDKNPWCWCISFKQAPK